MDYELPGARERADNLNADPRIGAFHRTPLLNGLGRDDPEHDGYAGGRAGPSLWPPHGLDVDRAEARVSDDYYADTRSTRYAPYTPVVPGAAQARERPAPPDLPPEHEPAPARYDDLRMTDAMFRFLLRGPQDVDAAGTAASAGGLGATPPTLTDHLDEQRAAIWGAGLEARLSPWGPGAGCEPRDEGP
jgi:hypothetical protein